MAFKERFGLDYLASKRREPSPPKPNDDTALLPGLQDAVVVYASRITEALHRSPGQAMRLFDLAKEVSARIDTIQPVMNFLVRNGYVERSEDPLGNDEFRLTDSGKRIAK